MHRRMVTLADLQAYDDGPDLSPIDISRLTGKQLSDDKVRADIERGYLMARAIPCGPRTWFRVPFAAARVYLKTRGFLRSTNHTTATAVSDLPS